MPSPSRESVLWVGINAGGPRVSLIEPPGWACGEKQDGIGGKECSSRRSDPGVGN